MTDKPRGPGRPPAAPLALDPAAIADLRALAKKLKNDPGALKLWLTEKRLFHVVFQDHLSTMAIEGDRGIIVNAEASKRFMDFSESLIDALKTVSGDGDPRPVRRKK